MTALQRLILEDEDTSYDIFVESTASNSAPGIQDDYESYGPSGPNQGGIGKGWDGSTSNTVPAATRVQLQKVHKTIQGYTQYAIGAFKNLAIADVEEINLKFNLKISAEGGMPMLASAKTEADFAIEVKCKFKENSPTA